MEIPKIMRDCVQSTPCKLGETLYEWKVVRGHKQPQKVNRVRYKVPF